MLFPASETNTITVAEAERLEMQRRMRDDIFDDIDDERVRQNVKFAGSPSGIQRHQMFVWQTVLTEEVGEVAEAMLETYFGKKGATLDDCLSHLRVELVQSAAVCVAIIERLDAADPSLLEPEGTFHK